MANLVLPHEITNGTTADATEVQGNFDAIEAWVNTETLRADGSVSLTGQLSLVGDPSSDNHAARKAWVEAQIAAFMPKGSIVPYAGSAAPSGWLLCDGAVVSRTTYATLFAVVGTTYNTGGEAGTDFRLPNLKGRFPAGRDAGGVTWADTLGERAGTADNNIVDHTHGLNGHTHDINHNHPSFATTDAAGSHSHYPQSGSNHTFAVYLGTQVQTTYTEGAGGTSWKIAGSTTGNAITGTDGDHNHTIDVPALGTTQSGGPATQTNTAAANGATSATNANLPPYLILNYIIRY